MVLDHLKQSPIGNKIPGMKKGTPNSKSPKASSSTAIKTAPKRPLENAEEEDAPKSGLSMTEILTNGTPQKKPRLSFSPKNGPLRSKDDIEDDEVDDDEEEEDDDDDDEVDEDEDEGSDDDDDDEDDDDEDEGSDEDEDSEDEDEEEVSESENENTKMKEHEKSTKNGRVKTPTDRVADAPTLEKANIPQKGKKTEQVSTETSVNSTTLTSSDQASIPKAYYLIPNPPRNFEEVKKVLANRSICVSNIQMLRTPMAVATVESKGELGSINTLNKPISIDGKTLHLIHLEASKEALQTIETATKTLLVTGIPKSVTPSALKSELPTDCRSCSVHLMSTGNRNRQFNAAFLNFASASLASKALDALANAKFENRTLHVNFAKDKAESQTNSLRGSTKTLLAEQLPPGVTEDQLKSIFTTAKKFKIFQRKGETVCYIDFEHNTAATEAFDKHNNGQIGQSTLNLHFVQSTDFHKSHITVEVGNVPPGTDAQKVAALFPGATSAVQLSADYFSISFPSFEVRRNAVKGKKVIGNTKLNATIVGGINRTICLAKNLPFDSTEQDVKSLYPEATSVSLNTRPNGKPAGTATVVFPNVDTCEKALAASKTLKGRNVITFLKRVPIEDTSDSHAQTKPKNEKQSKKSKEIALIPVGSASEDDEDDDEAEADESDDAEDDEDGDDDEGEDDDEEDDEEDDDNEENESEQSETEQQSKTKVLKTKNKTKEAKISQDNEDDESGDDDDESDEEDDEEEEGDSEDDGDEQESVDEGIDEDEEMPLADQKQSFDKKDKKQFKFENKRGFPNRGRGSFNERGRGFRGGKDRGGGFSHRGGGRGFHNNGGQRGRGGDGFRGRGRGRFNRGRGNRG